METNWKHDEIKVSDIKGLISKAHAILCIVIHALDTKILIGEINRPDVPAEKKPRKKRVTKVKPIVDFPPTSVLPDADTGKAGEFFKKKREKKIDGGE